MTTIRDRGGERGIVLRSQREDIGTSKAGAASVARVLVSLATLELKLARSGARRRGKRSASPSFQWAPKGVGRLQADRFAA
jgi:hypothetical protein